MQRLSINEIAESMMAFNTNYKDTGLFGVYAVAKVCLLSYAPWIDASEFSMLLWIFFNQLLEYRIVDGVKLSTIISFLVIFSCNL